jgi:predicted transcriptional regulator of viral defense system
MLHKVGRYVKLPIESNMRTGTATERILSLAAHQTLIRPRDVEALGIAREFLLRLHREGILVRPARGVYALAESSVTEHHTLAVAAKRVPRGAVCLLSALRFYGLTTQDPHEVWIAIDFKAHKPSIESPALRVLRFSGRALTEGVDTHVIEGVQVRIYCPAKTVADCFKYRNKIGVDVAIEALRDALRTRKATVDEIHRFAKICRVANVMRPYLEAGV